MATAVRGLAQQNLALSWQKDIAGVSERVRQLAKLHDDLLERVAQLEINTSSPQVNCGRTPRSCRAMTVDKVDVDYIVSHNLVRRMDELHEELHSSNRAFYNDVMTEVRACLSDKLDASDFAALVDEVRSREYHSSWEALKLEDSKRLIQRDDRSCSRSLCIGSAEPETVLARFEELRSETEQRFRQVLEEMRKGLATKVDVACQRSAPPQLRSHDAMEMRALQSDVAKATERAEASMECVEKLRLNTKQWLDHVTTTLASTPTTDILALHSDVAKAAERADHSMECVEKLRLNTRQWLDHVLHDTGEIAERLNTIEARVQPYNAKRLSQPKQAYKPSIRPSPPSIPPANCDCQYHPRHRTLSAA